TSTVAGALGIVGWTRFQQGDVSAAERYYRHALTAIEGSGVAAHAISLAVRRAALANAFVVQERWDEALKAFEQRERGLRSDPEQFKRYGSRHMSWAYAL